MVREEEKTTDIERLKNLHKLADNQYLFEPNPLERVRSLSGKIDEYLLFWPNLDQKVVICARTGRNQLYYRTENGVVKEYKDDDLLNFVDEIDNYIQELDERTNVSKKEDDRVEYRLTNYKGDCNE